jgi:hypothetical protein
MPKVAMPDADYMTLTNRLQDFGVAYAFSNAAMLTLTATDLNALIQRHESQAVLKDRLCLEIKGDQIKGQFTVPLDAIADKFGWQSAKGRHLNGIAALHVGMENGILQVTCESLELNGKAAPGWFFAKVRGKNLLQETANDPRKADFYNRVESIQVKDSRLTLRLKGANTQP